MAYGFTLHSIRREGKDLPIHSVVEFSETDFDDMLKLEAVREPTENEMKLYKLAHPDPVVDAVAAQAKPEKPAANARKKPAAGNTTDSNAQAEDGQDAADGQGSAGDAGDDNGDLV